MNEGEAGEVKQMKISDIVEMWEEVSTDMFQAHQL